MRLSSAVVLALGTLNVGIFLGLHRWATAGALTLLVGCQLAIQVPRGIRW